MEKHLLQAAERGDAEAQFNLGVMYENGFDDSRYVVEGSRPEAVEWFRAAAEQGLPRAQLKLAEIYAAEPAISEAPEKSCFWYLVAAKGLRGARLQSAQSAYRRAALRLTPAQIANAMSCAESWQPKGPAAAGALDRQKNSVGGRT
jgi:TPR repeat protein